MPEQLIAPLLLALTSAPVFVIAVLVGRGHLHLVNGLDRERVADPDGLARRLSALLWLIGLAMLASAAGFYWAGADDARMTMIVIALVAVVNALGIALLLAVAKARREYRKPPARR
jgi:hypothetical protein